MSTLYDLDSVKARVAGDIEAARLIYAEEIFSWTDAYSEMHGQGEEASAEQLLHTQAIGRLWMHYAAMEQQLKQWKKTVQVFEDALLDEVASRCLELYLAYVSFFRARGKISSAQKVLVRALTATGPLHTPALPPVLVRIPPSSTSSDVLTGDMRELVVADLLWAQFLLMMRSSESGGDSPDLKLEQLHTMLSTQVGEGSPLAPPSSFELVEEITARLSQSGESGPGGPSFDRLVEALVLRKGEAEQVQEQEQLLEAQALPEDESPNKRPRLDLPTSSSTLSSALQGRVERSDTPDTKSERLASRDQGLEHQHEQSSPARAAAGGVSLPSLIDFDDMSGLASNGGLECMLTSLLTSFRHRPTLLFSAAHKEPLSSGFRGLDSALIGDIERMFASCGVKAGHESAESLEMDLLAARKTQHSMLTRTLDVLEGLWTCQGLKEGHFDLWFSTLLGSHRREEEVLRRENYEEEARLRASKPSATSLDILRSRHENALRSRRIYASLQTDLLNANVNRILCKLRKEQEDVLRLISFPYSDEIDSDALYSYHNLKKGKLDKNEKAAELSSQESESKFEQMEVCFQKQRAIIGALLSLCPALSPTPLAPAATVSAAVPVPLLERGSSSFSISSTGSHASPRSPDSSSIVAGEKSSSTKKKRRRKLVDTQEQHESLRRRSGSGSGYSTGAGGLDLYDPFSTASSNVGMERGTPRGSLLGHKPGAGGVTQPSQLDVKQPTTTPPAFTTRPLIPLTALARPSSTSERGSATSLTSSTAAPGTTKAANLAKIAALLASKKAGKK